jgi:chromosome segregation ATPase
MPDNQEHQGSGSTWYLKADDGQIYGPIEINQLRDWADNCRIAPGNQISQDKTNWKAVETVPALGMEWMLELASGRTFGPISKEAVREFLNNKAATPSTTVRNVKSGRSTTAGVLLESGGATPAAAPAAPTPASPARPTASAATDGDINRLKEELERARKDAAAREDSLRAEINQLKQQGQKLEVKGGAQPADEARIKTLENESAMLRRELEAAQQAADQVDRLQQQLQQMRDQSSRRESELKLQVDELAAKQSDTAATRRIQELGAQLDELKGKLNIADGLISEKDQQIERQLQQARDLQSGMQRLKRDLESEVRRLQEELERAIANQKTKELEEQKALYAALREKSADREQVLSGEVEEARVRLLEVESRAQSLEDRAAQLSRQLNAAQDSVDEKQAFIQQQQEHVRQLEENARTNEQSLLERLHRAEAETKRLSGEVTGQQLQLDDRLREESELREEATRLQGELEALRAAADQEVSEARAREAEATASLERLRDELAQAIARADQLEWEIGQKESEWSDEREPLLQERDALRDKTLELESQLTEAGQSIESLTGQNRALAAAESEFKKAEASLLARMKQVEGDLNQYKGLLEEEWERAKRRDAELANTNKLYGEELARRQISDASILELEDRLRDEQAVVEALQEQESAARAAVEATQQQLAAQQDEFNREVASLQAGQREAVTALERANREMERRQTEAAERERVQATERDELLQQVEQVREERAALESRIDQLNLELEQQREQIREEQERRILEVENLQYRSMQLEQESKGMGLRLEQQKKFYENEREQRRQRESELLSLKKAHQEAQSSIRKLERNLAQQQKHAEEEIDRLRQQNEIMASRLRQRPAAVRAPVKRAEPPAAPSSSLGGGLKPAPKADDSADA